MMRGVTQKVVLVGKILGPGWRITGGCGESGRENRNEAIVQPRRVVGLLVRCDGQDSEAAATAAPL